MLEICSTSLLQCRHHRRSPQSHRHSTRSRSIDERHRRRRDSSRGRSHRSRSREHRYCSTERRDLICSGLHRVRSCSTGHKWVGQTAQRTSLATAGRMGRAGFWIQRLDKAEASMRPGWLQGRPQEQATCCSVTAAITWIVRLVRKSLAAGSLRW